MRKTAPFSVGDYVEMTAQGRALAKKRRVSVKPGTVRDVIRAGLRTEQVFVRYVENPGIWSAACLWWPARAWQRRPAP